MTKFRWYRKLCGGIWQHWNMEGGGSFWFMSDDLINRPHPACRGTPIVEYHYALAM